MQTKEDIDPSELEKFSAAAQDWWNPEGEMRSLHHMNPVRLDYIDQAVHLAGKHVLDLGCGGGILTEAMAVRGARVTGLDPSEELIATARAHSLQTGIRVDYATDTASRYATQFPACYEVITCMELLEHVPNVPELIASCATLLKPGGHLLLSTLNRTWRSYAAAIVGAEYILGLLPRGTHAYHKFIRPAEMGKVLRRHGFHIRDISGILYLPGVNRCALTASPAVNYLLHATYR